MLPTTISFDDYVHAVRQAKVSFVLTQRAQTPWWLEYYPGKSTEIQFGSDGGASVADGVLAENGYVLIARHLPSTVRITLNGDVLAPGELAVLPPGGHFIFAAEGPRTWFSFGLPRELVERLAAPHPGLALRLREKRPCIVPSRPELMHALVGEAEGLRASHRGRDAGGMLREEARMMEIASLILSDAGVGCRADLDTPGLKSLEIVSRALLRLPSEDAPESFYVDDLARAAEVHTRTLLRAFHRVVGMGPIRYLKFRQLNAIRRQLLASAGPDTTVTGIMYGLGASDLGRVSAAYRALFGELPSETLRLALRRNDAGDSAPLPLAPFQRPGKRTSA